MSPDKDPQKPHRDKYLESDIWQMTLNELLKHVEENPEKINEIRELQKLKFNELKLEQLRKFNNMLNEAEGDLEKIKGIAALRKLLADAEMAEIEVERARNAAEHEKKEQESELEHKNKQRALELQEKELDLKERQLALEERKYKLIKAKRNFVIGLIIGLVLITVGMVFLVKLEDVRVGLALITAGVAALGIKGVDKIISKGNDFIG